jgi:predicted nucleic acid-binding protein
MNRIVVDTNVIVALIDNNDVHHSKALNLIIKLEDENNSFIILDCVVNEVFSVLARRSLQRGYSFKSAADKFRIELKKFDIIRVYPLLNQMHDSIVDFMIVNNGNLNYHDSLICLAMNHKKIKNIATFDKGFKNIEWLTVFDQK